MEKNTVWSNYASKQVPSITIRADKMRWEITATINFNGIKCESTAYCLSSGHGRLPSAVDYAEAVGIAKHNCQSVLAANLVSLYGDIMEIKQFYTPLTDVFGLENDDDEIIICALCGEPVKRSEADHHLLHVHKHEP